MSARMDVPAFVKAHLPPAPARVLEVGCGDGRLIVIEHAWERFAGPTASWYLERRRARDPDAPKSLEACLAEWNADHAGLHDSAAMRREIDRRFSERLFRWTPYLHGELGEAFEQEERTLIEEGAIQATGFVYVGEREYGPS